MPNIDSKKGIAIFHCGFIYSGGGERIVLEEARGLVKRGYKVCVYAPTLDKNKCFPDLVKGLNVKTFLPSFFDSLPLKNAIRMLVTSIIAPILSVNFRNIDIFIGANQPGAWIAFCMAKMLRKPYIVYLNQPNRIVYPRSVDVEFGWYTTVKDYQVLYKFLKPFKPLLAWLDKVSIKNADRILANGAYIKNLIEIVYSKEVIDAPAGAWAFAPYLMYWNPHTAYTGRIKVAGKIIEKPYALITNRHDPQKRFDYVIRAMKYVNKKYSRAKLIIPGPFTAHTIKLIRMAKALKIEDKVLFLGQVEEKDLQRLYRHSVLYCYPAPQEDFGLGPLEAGGWGVPTVAWRHAGPTVTVEGGVSGYLAKPYDVEDYARKMIRLLKNQKLRAKMGKAALRRTKSIFSWNNHLDILEESILQLI